MKVKAKTSCPLCNSKVKCISFHLRAGMFNKLTFWCRSCKLTFETDAMHYKINNGTIEFFHISHATEIRWRNKNFNPSER